MNVEFQRQPAPACFTQLHRLPTARDLRREADAQLLLGKHIAAERLEALAEAAREAGR